MIQVPVIHTFCIVCFLSTVPPMLSIPNQLEGAYIGQDVTLECHTEAYPDSINYWTTEHGDMIVSGKFILYSKYTKHDTATSRQF